MTSTIALSRKGNLEDTIAADPTGQPRASAGLRAVASFESSSKLFLRIPPFPGANVRNFQVSSTPGLDIDRAQNLVDQIRRHQVGGSYWGARPELPSNSVLLRASLDAGRVEALWPGASVLRWSDGDGPGLVTDRRIKGTCDPWHVIAGAEAIVVQCIDEFALIAAILNVPIFIDGDASLERQQLDPASILSSALSASFENPFGGQPLTVEEAVGLCGHWRSLIDSNRNLAGGLGFAFWKQETVAAMLWDGTKPFQFLSQGTDVEAGQAVAVWRSKAPAAAVARFERAGTTLIEVEDGFLRSQGLGANCVPPLSITIDRLGPYFDHTQPSELEMLLQRGPFDEQTIKRAERLRSIIVEGAIGKYGSGVTSIDRPAGNRRHVLVPGQVEDDRSVMTGGGGLSNLDLLRRVRADAPDAYIIYKPHPDVVAGHRKGAVSDHLARKHADAIAVDVPVASLIDIVDEVHVNTSLTGFEALLRGKAVTTHGVPFYAGWGVTRDLGEVPARRTAKRTVDELVAAALLLYPRYLDPITGLPCPAEIVVERLCEGAAASGGLLVRLRRMQGRIMRGVRGVLS